MTSDFHLNIINGPSKFDLMASLFDGKVVEFTHDNKLVSSHPAACLKEQPCIALGSENPCWIVKIMSIEREDGSNESWNIIPHVIKGDRHDADNVKYKFYYNSRNRKGVITLKF